jgi:hypothetical protein
LFHSVSVGGRFLRRRQSAALRLSDAFSDGVSIRIAGMLAGFWTGEASETMSEVFWSPGFVFRVMLWLSIISKDPSLNRKSCRPGTMSR